MDAARARATEAMMPVSRTMTAIVARTLSEMKRDITVPQLRVLVLLNSRGQMNLSALAEHLDVNPSNASRTCDQLVNEGLA
ncbi:MAG TPA: MarR family transcriptional regulator, partial [Nocardioides sp.]